jgi:anti-anti-sigma factor
MSTSCDFSFHVSRDLSAVVVTVSGDLDVFGCVRLGAVLGDLIDGQGNMNVVVDLSHTSSVDPAGLGVFGAAAKLARHHGGQLSFTGASDDLNQAMAGLPASMRTRRQAGSCGAVLPHPHMVEFYEDDEFLAESVCGYMEPGLRQDDAVVVVATKRHRDLFEAALVASSVDLEAARSQGRYVDQDAEELLSQFMVNGLPDQVRFEVLMAKIISRASQAGRSVRIYGEMVAILWDQGNIAAAIALEDHWNESTHSHYSAPTRCPLSTGRKRPGPSGASATSTPPSSPRGASSSGTGTGLFEGRGMTSPKWLRSTDEEVALDVADVFAAALEKTEGGPVLQLLIGGEWRAAGSGETFDVYSPIDGSVIGRAQKGNSDDVDAAIAAANEARHEWRETPAAQRLEVCERAAAIVEENATSFVDAIVSNLGKTPEQASSEVDATQVRLGLAREEVRKIFGEYLPGDWIPDSAGKSAVVLREPVGIVAAVGPFNYPLFLSASKIIPALAAGNTLVAKAPSNDPVPLLLFVRALEEAGLPSGVLNLITGPGGEIGDHLASHPDVGMISFTGSTSAGRAIASAAGPKPLHLEMGGNAAAIILDDADLDLAAEKSVMGAFNNAGQRCDAISRVLVTEGAYDDYMERALEEAGQWHVGDPRAEGVKVGPLVSASAAEWVHELVENAVEKGAALLAGGEMHEAYHQPTVLAGVPLDADIVWEETFGPVLAVVKVADLDEALEVANRSRYGLDSAVFTTDLDAAWRAARALECGQVTVNDAPKHGVGHFPFGGRKPDSGLGREGLGYSIDECTMLKTVVLPS